MLSKLVNFAGFLAAAAIGGGIVAWVGNHGAPRPTPGGHGAGAPAQPVVPAVPVVEVGRMPAAARLKLGGYVEPRNTVRLTAQAPGRVVFVAGQEGDRVSSGQLVVGLDADALGPEYRSAWAALAGDMAAQQNAQTQLYQGLYGPRNATMGGPGYDAYEKMFTPFYNMAQGLFGSMMPGMGGANSPFGSLGPMMTQAQQQRSWSALNNLRADYERRSRRR